VGRSLNGIWIALFERAVFKSFPHYFAGDGEQVPRAPNTENGHTRKKLAMSNKYGESRHTNGIRYGNGALLILEMK
jgi:hypothetical protein